MITDCSEDNNRQRWLCVNMDLGNVCCRKGDFSSQCTWIESVSNSKHAKECWRNRQMLPSVFYKDRQNKCV